jgi:hypothetical protein
MGSLIDLREILLGCNRRYLKHLSALDDFSAGVRALNRLTEPRRSAGAARTTLTGSPVTPASPAAGDRGDQAGERDLSLLPHQTRTDCHRRTLSPHPERSHSGSDLMRFFDAQNVTSRLIRSYAFPQPCLGKSVAPYKAGSGYSSIPEQTLHFAQRFCRYDPATRLFPDQPGAGGRARASDGCARSKPALLAQVRDPGDYARTDPSGLVRSVAARTKFGNAASPSLMTANGRPGCQPCSRRAARIGASG